MPKLFFKRKDGGAESTSTGYWLIEWKSVFSIVVLKFEGLSREAYHSHAFEAVSWLLRGKLRENFRDCTQRLIQPSLLPFRTHKVPMHKVDSLAPVSWAVSFRGPWDSTWKDMAESDGVVKTLTNGRKEV